MRTLLLAMLTTMGTIGLAGAQSVAGVYTTPTSNGVITLTLEQDAQGVSGTLVGDDGTSFRVQAAVQNGELTGNLANPTGNVAAIQGGFDAAGVRFWVVPLDANGQLNRNAAQEFVMARQQGGTAAGPQGASPLSGLGGGGSAAAAGGAISGSYQGDIAGTPATLTLDRNGASFSGVIDAGGYGYTLSGTAAGNSGRGTLIDGQTGARMDVELAEQAGALTVTILATDPNTGQVQRVPFEFRRGDGGAGGYAGNPAGGMGGGAGGGAAYPPGGAGQGSAYPPSGGAQGGYGAGGGAQGQATNVQRDPALVGSWTYRETYVSNDATSDFSAVSRWFMRVYPDGNYEYGSGGMSAGLDNALGSVQGNSGSGDVTRGQWRTEGDVIYIMEGGSGQWVPYARYYVEGGSMMLTYGNGKRQTWRRQ